MNLGGLREELAAQHVSLSVSETGRLKYDAPGPLPVALVEAMREHKAALLEALQNDTQTPSKRPKPDPITAGQQPGRCGCCARWVAHPAPAEHLGICDAGRRAHGWLDGAPLAPVETQAALLCQVYGGSGWREMPRNAAFAPVSELERPA